MAATQKEVWFEETLASLQNNVTQIFEMSIKEYQEQHRVIDEYGLKPNLYFLEDIEQDIKNELSLIRRRYAEQGPVCTYDDFPTLEEKIKIKAKKALLRELVLFFQEEAPDVQIEPSALLAFIKEDLAGHKNFIIGKNKCVDHFKDEIERQTLEHFILAAPEAGRLALLEELWALVRNVDQEWSNVFINRARVNYKLALRERTKRNLDGPVREMRQHIALEQFDLFQPLKQGRWQPDYEEVERHYYDIYVRYSFHPFNEEPRIINAISREGISETEFDQHILLNEAEEFINEAVKTLTMEGLKALREQMRLVEDLQPVMERRFQEHADPLHTIVTAYTREVETGWARDKRAIIWKSAEHEPDNSADKYVALFGYVQEDIQEKAKDLLDAHQQGIGSLVTEVSTPEEAPMDQTPVIAYTPFPESETETEEEGLQDQGEEESESGEGGGEEQAGACSACRGGVPTYVLIDIDMQKDGSADMVFRFIGHTRERVSSFQVDGNPLHQLQERIDQNLVQSGILENFRHIAESAVLHNLNEEAATFYITARVYERGVYYSYIYYLRESIRRRMASFPSQEKEIAINWYDGIFSESARGAFKPSSWVREKSYTLLTLSASDFR